MLTKVLFSLKNNDLKKHRMSSVPIFLGACRMQIYRHGGAVFQAKDPYSSRAADLTSVTVVLISQSKYKKMPI